MEKIDINARRLARRQRRIERAVAPTPVNPREAEARMPLKARKHFAQNLKRFRVLSLSKAERIKAGKR